MSTIPSEEAIKIAKDNLAQIIGDAELIDKTDGQTIRAGNTTDAVSSHFITKVWSVWYVS